MKKIKWFVVLGSACLTPVDKVGEGDDEGECTDGIDNDQDGYLDQEDAGCPEIEQSISPSVLVFWDSQALRLELSGNQSETYYNFGIAETSGECLTEGGCWTGEDCFQGFETEEGDRLLYCHPFYAGTSLELEYGAEPYEVNEGESTVFTGGSFQSKVSYLLNELNAIEDGSCWTWGADPSYYQEYSKSCTEM